MKKYNVPNINITIYAPDIGKAMKVAKKIEKGVYQLVEDWIEKSKKWADKYDVKITPKNQAKEKQK